ncbi:MAG: alpha-L-glycero-D-manno-heptose beta-1,4-glucosyltransferase [Coxiella sp. RIFCSPHIGHO2_12_FULL_44_14]|nr:MAG: alpha-L-glycero-D-manno-heptose beta-1,4-glucosyltransferase [Coxiella sp. RIFCSPHIGHO2_12_FULL_44_14]
MEMLSACIITYNQIDKIQAAIQSVAWATEVVVVDSYSTDGTTELAQQLGARVVQVPFQGFGDLRNQALKACHYEWILSLDSDERCTPAVQAEILSLIRSAEASDIYYIPRKNYFMGRWIQHAGWYPDYRQPQLFRKAALRYTLDPVHEGYHYDTQKPVGYLKNAIWQIPFKNLAEMMDKANRYSSLGVTRLEKKHGHASLWRALIHTLWAFFKLYVLKRGFLDGWPGFIIAVGNSYGTFYRHAKFYEKEHPGSTINSR